MMLIQHSNLGILSLRNEPDVEGVWFNAQDKGVSEVGLKGVEADSEGSVN